MGGQQGVKQILIGGAHYPVRLMLRYNSVSVKTELDKPGVTRGYLCKCKEIMKHVLTNTCFVAADRMNNKIQ